jgi:hypothetical protein
MVTAEARERVNPVTANDYDIELKVRLEVGYGFIRLVAMDDIVEGDAYLAT